MANNEILNTSQTPRAVYNVLLSLAPVIREARDTFPERFSGKTAQEFVNEIATVVRMAEAAGV